MQIRLRLYGVFRSAAEGSEFKLEIPDTQANVRLAIQRIVSQEGFQNLRSLLTEGPSSDPRSNALIMVSGREINSLKGLDTELWDNDELALLPIAHGG
jgi:molybdopterin converting factor small subunit